ncbi:MAG: hypothetical protein K5978_02565 [Campylobacter sp.]|nr:hypothetical protein [Campylobacter sp.]
MQNLDSKIIKFLHFQELLCLCTLDENSLPYASSAYYAFDEKNLRLLLAGGAESSHIQSLKYCDKVSGAIAYNNQGLVKIQGVQFRGIMKKAEKYAEYFKKFPFALAMKAEIYEIKLTWIKYTDNTLGFGKKLIWVID